MQQNNTDPPEGEDLQNGYLNDLRQLQKRNEYFT